MDESGISEDEDEQVDKPNVFGKASRSFFCIILGPRFGHK